jgi:branched-chain amino acid transport system permease protein
MDWLFFSEIGLAGIGSGGLYALTGLALVLIYKATRVVNMAIGEILMFGAYVFMGFSAGLALPVWVAIPLAILVTGLMGGVIERLIIRPMLGESAISIFMVTIGLGSVLVGLVEIIWGANPQRLVEFMPSDPIFIGEAYL